MTRLYAVKVLKGHIKFLAKTEHPAKCIDKEGNVAWELPSVKYGPYTEKGKKIKGCWSKFVKETKSFFLA